jgi:hypothetical protein
MKLRKISRKGSIEFSWIFALIVGALILFLAFYFVGNKLLAGNQEQSTLSSHGLDILLNPFSQFGDIKVMSKDMIKLSTIQNLSFYCDPTGAGQNFNEISTTVDGNEGIPKRIYDKYIFSPQYIESKNIQVLSIPFEMPWRVADIIVLIDMKKKYCFIGAPDSMKNTLGDAPTGLNLTNVYFVDANMREEDCPTINTKTVCFSGSNCDIIATLYSDNTGKIVKDFARSEIYFAGDALMYAAIFSDSDIYECNVKRLASRIENQIDIYKGKSRSMTQKGCSFSFDFELLGTSASNIANLGENDEITSGQISKLYLDAEGIKNQNKISDCPLF